MVDYEGFLEPLSHKRIYFAHPMVSYGSQDVRAADAWLRGQFGKDEVRNPEDMDWSRYAAKIGNEAVFQAVIYATDEVVVLEHHGYIGRGCYREVELALLANKPVWSLWQEHLFRVDSMVRIDELDWKYRYAILVI